MELTSVLFLLCLAAVLVVYYLAPKLHGSQWCVLLAASWAYYLYTDLRAGVFLLISTLITYACACRIRKIYQADEQNKRGAKVVLLAGMLSNLGILAVLKYTGFILQNIGAIFGTSVPVLKFVLPLGISYYTFQTVGYLLDVYWKRVEAQTNVLKLALFVSFFPQLAQGPIGRYDRLSPQLFEEHPFDWKNTRYGVWRFIWGLFKKMVLADWAGVFRDAIFSAPDQYSGIAIFGVLLYTVELYGNFSGGLDMVIGVASMFGVKLDENFRRPFFSRSVTEFWKRWHITLGTWMKDYVFIPMSMSRWMRAFGRWSKKVFGKKTGRVIPLCLSNLVVFFLVGIWHGPTWANIGWGLYNGIIIASSNLLSNAYSKAKTRLHIHDESAGWKTFTILRTFGLMNLSWYFDCAASFSDAWMMICNSLTHFQPSQFLTIAAGKAGVSYTPYALATLGIGTTILFVVELLQEKGKIGDVPQRLHWTAQAAILILMLVSIPLFGPMSTARGFIYAQF